MYSLRGFVLRIDMTCPHHALLHGLEHAECRGPELGDEQPHVQLQIVRLRGLHAVLVV